ncbi:hypothetical protein VTN96DRAFT_1251 [Rasamsonia emersonii]
MSSATHRDLPCGALSQSWWSQFIAEEELIRTLTYVFLLDTGFAIFYNTPPRMVIAELQMDLTCPEICFQASTANECLAHFRAWVTTRTWPGTPSLHSAVCRICQADSSMDGELKSASGQTTLRVLTRLRLHAVCVRDEKKTSSHRCRQSI